MPPPGLLKRSPVTYIGGYVFHIGFAFTLFFFVPHIELVRGLTGQSWPGLPMQVVDIAAVAAILALFAVLASRLMNPVKRCLSASGLSPRLLTLPPPLTGYLAFHHVVADYTLMLALHVLGRATAGGASLHQAVPYRKRVRLALVQRRHLRKKRNLASCPVTRHSRERESSAFRVHLHGSGFRGKLTMPVRKAGEVS
ncbi:MAG: hypothetical protein M5R42_06170 [Rhodocyclaceae bacterium]|nr:hypothetical protein [Rhodocyclaceae bacterium]